MELALVIHVLAGILTLITGTIILFLKKGDSRHKIMGWVYVILMFIIFVTSTIVSLIKGNLFLLLIGFFSFYLVHSGVSVNRFRKTGSALVTDKVFTVTYFVCFMGMLLLAVKGWMNGNTALAIVLGVFGLIGAELVRHDIRYYLLNRSAENHELIREHIGRFIGSFIAAITAFAVNNVHFLPPVVVWLLPTLLGFLLIGYFSKPYKKRVN